MISWSLIFWNALYAAINANAAAYCLIATGLNVHVGYTGLLNFGQAAFAAVGAYAFAIPIANYGWHWYFALPFVFLCSILLALLLGIPTLRLRADYLATLSQEASFARRVERGVFLVSPMSQDCLRRAIEEPADRSGLRLEPGRQ